MRSLTALLLVLLYGTLPGLRAQGNGSSSDLDFAVRFLTSNRVAFEFNRIAVDRVVNDDIRKFAHSMLDSGTMLRDWLRQIASRKGIALPSDPIDGNDVMERIAEFTGTDFDRSYVEAELSSQREQVDLCKREIAYGTDPDLKSFAAESLKRLRRQAGLLAELDSTARAQAMR